MDRSFATKGALIAGAFVGSVILLLPPTETKASWTNVRQAPPARVYDPPAPAEPSWPAAYAPPPPSESAAARRPDRWDMELTDEATAREVAMAEADRAYGDGYVWASDREVQDARECRRLDGPREDGCRDFVASLGPSPEATAADEADL